MKKQVIGYCAWCEKPIYEKEDYFVTIDDKVVHYGNCLDDYLYECIEY